jgi:predicted RNase H-like nuclease
MEENKTKGIAERLDVISRHGIALTLENLQELRRLIGPSEVGSDDLVDSVVALITARRMYEGTAESIPYQSEKDERGLRMEMVW